MSYKELLEKLKKKREEIAHKENKELYMVFPNATLEATAKAEPETEAELIEIKGWGDTKVKKYGKEFLRIINGEESVSKESQPSLLDDAMKASEDEDHAFSVSSYLDMINIGLKKSEARVKGEVTSVNERKKYIRFKIKDDEDESILKCFMWANNYKLCDVEVEEGLEVIVEGHPEVYKPYGEFSFRADTVELVGEGALKKAYEKLKKKLKKEGVFAPERKRELPKFPKKIGVITSLRGGTVIHDFENNLGKFGFQIRGIDARVEGQKAVKSLMEAMKKAKKLDLDVLVIIRGGGSIESLQAFDNENIVREVVDFPVPVIAGIGHHEDVTLAAMAADKMESTPQGVAEMLNKPWEEARSSLRMYERSLVSDFETMLSEAGRRTDRLSEKLRKGFENIISAFRRGYSSFRSQVNSFGHQIAKTREGIERMGDSMVMSMSTLLEKAESDIEAAEKSIRMNDPERQLDLGYSIVSKNGKVVKSIDKVEEGDGIDIKVSDGKILSTVDEVNEENNS